MSFAKVNMSHAGRRSTKRAQRWTGMSLLWVALFAFAGTARASAETDVVVRGGRLSIRAERAPLTEVLSRIHDVTGMVVVYDGPQPTETVTITILDQAFVTAMLRLFEGRGLRFVMATDVSGIEVETLVESTAKGGERATPTNAVEANEPKDDFHAERARAQLAAFQRHQLEEDSTANAY